MIRKLIYFTAFLNTQVMNVKLDTKEKFTVITPTEPEISANMTGDMNEMFVSYLSKDIPHVVVNMEQVNSMDEKAVEMLAGLQQQFYENNTSFIVCALQKNVESLFEKKGLLDTMNITPSESEAWDIVQMEEIEREIMGDFDNGTDS